MQDKVNNQMLALRCLANLFSNEKGESSIVNFTKKYLEYFFSSNYFIAKIWKNKITTLKFTLKATFLDIFLKRKDTCGFQNGEN